MADAMTEERASGVTATGEPPVGVAARAGKWTAALVALGIVLIAFNLRPAVTSVGSLLGSIQSGLHLSGTVAGLLAALPAICFGAFSGLTPRLARRLGAHRLLVFAMAALVAGLLLRSLAGGPAAFIAASVLALCGVAVGNVTLPVLVRSHFPGRVGLVTGLYTMALNLGTALASALSVPAAHAMGGWRGGLAVWGAFAAIAVLPWLFVLRADPTDRASRREERDTGPAHRSPARSRIGWALGVFFGTQSLQAYVMFGWLARIFTDAGYSPTVAGVLVSGLTLVGAPVAFLLPTVAARFGRDQRPYVVGLVACYVVGYLGLWLAPHSGAIIWTVLLGLGGSAFALALLMVGLRSRTPAGTTSLSAFAQSVGYLIAASGPVLVGFLHQETGGWQVPLLLLGLVLVPQLIAGLVAGRRRYLEDER